MKQRGKIWRVGEGETTESLEAAQARVALGSSACLGPPQDSEDADPMPPICPQALKKTLSKGGTGVGTDGWPKTELRRLPLCAFEMPATNPSRKGILT